MIWHPIKRSLLVATLTLGAAAVIGVTLVAASAPRIITHCGDMRRTKALADVAAISEALTLFRSERGALPTANQGLRALVEISSLSTGDGYLWKMPMDPWGHPYQYVTDGKAFSVTSFGADGTVGGDGPNEDITSDES